MMRFNFTNLNLFKYVCIGVLKNPKISQNNITQHEVKPLTSIRGVAAIYVLLYHFVGHNLDRNSITGSIIQHGYIAVDLFFLLSGFVIFFSYQGKFKQLVSIKNNSYEFIVKRFARIYPLYFVVTIYTFVMHKFFITGDTHRNYNFFELLTNLTLIQNWGLSKSIGGPTWSLSLEWAAYILFPITGYLIATSQSIRLKVIFAVAVLAIFFAAYLPRESISLAASGLLDLTAFDSIFPILRCLGEFTLGMTLCRAMNNELIINLFSKPYLDIIIVFSILLCLLTPALDVVIVLLFSLLILSLAINSKTITYQTLDTKLLWWLGTISYSIYLLHGRFAKFIDGLSYSLHPILGDFALLGATVILIVAVISVASFSYLTIEIHGKTLLQKILLRKRVI